MIPKLDRFSESDLTRKQKARRGLTLFFALLIPLSAVSEAFIILTGNIVVGSVVLMWMPGLSSIITRLVYLEGFADVAPVRRLPLLAEPRVKIQITDLAALEPPCPRRFLRG